MYYSGMYRTQLRLPDELHDILNAEAKSQRRSLHAHLLWIIDNRPKVEITVPIVSRASLLEQAQS